MELFGTAGIRGPVADRVTPTLAVSVGAAAGLDAQEREPDPGFVVGRDGRVTGEALAASVAAGLQSVGVPVVRVGQVPTPALAFASRGRRGVMVTASHNPPGDNGLKLFVDGVEYDEAAEDRVADRVADDPTPTEWASWTTAGSEEVLPAYRDRICAYAREHGAPLEDLSVVVDCGNGMAGLAVPQVLDRLGAAVTTLHGNVDGCFPGRASKPTPESLSGCSAFIADGAFDLGVALDGDADRIAVLDGAGAIVHEDTILAILARHLVETATVDDPVVVTTPNASARVDDQVRTAGGRTVRTSLGTLHEEVARLAAAGETVVFAAEPWKHIHPGLGGWIDGVASAALLARLVAAAGLAPLRDPVVERPYRKTSVECPDDAKPEVMAALAAELPSLFGEVSVTAEHGIRITFPDDAWVLVRPSGTEPKIRVYVEAEDVDAIVDRVREQVVATVAATT